MADLLLEPEFLRKLDGLTVTSRRIFTGKIKGERRSKKRGLSVEFADYRDYVYGDDPRFVDWNVFGRLDRLFLKLFMEEEDLHIYILVDTSGSMDFGDPKKIDYARKVAAAIGYIGLVNMDRVSVASFSTRIRSVFPLTRGKSQVWRMFDFLQSAECGGETSLTDSCRDFVLTNRRKGVAVLISDFFDRGGCDDALKSFMHRRFDLYAVQVLAKEEIDPPHIGHLKLVDSEVDDTVEITVNESLLKAYRESLRAFCGGIKKFCTSRGATYLSATTDVPFDSLVLEYLRKGGLLK